MHQQINLFQPMFREQRKLFGATTVGWSFGAVVAALLALWMFGNAKVGHLEREVAQVREQQRAQEQMATTAGSLRSARANPADIQARVAKLSQELADRTRALDLLQGGFAGNTAGFASKLEALANQHVDGLWITRIDLGSTAGSMSLSGATLQADLVPQYLKALAVEPALQGTRFDDFSIERSKGTELQSAVQFRAGNVLLGSSVKGDRS